MEWDSMHTLANPARFTALAGALAPWVGGLATALLALGLYLALLASPPDYQQGETVRIMYVHVPSAWMALFVYACMAVASLCGLVWKTVLAELTCKAIAPIGAAFTALCLATGSLWGAPMWGTWWVWDARLTSVLLLFFLYLHQYAEAGGDQDHRDRRDDPMRRDLGQHDGFQGQGRQRQKIEAAVLVIVEEEALQR